MELLWENDKDIQFMADCVIWVFVRFFELMAILCASVISFLTKLTDPPILCASVILKT